MRIYKLAATWRREHPGVRALLLESATGEQLLLRHNAPLPPGRWALKGVIS